MKRFAVLFILAQLFMLTACSENTEKFDEPALIFEKDGKITNVIVESFKEDYYSLEGLTAFFNEKVDDYKVQNIGGGDVNIDSIVVEDGVARAVLSFDDASVYSDFYRVDTFYGSVNDAYDAGFFFDTTLKSISSPETIVKEDIMQMKDKGMIIVSEPLLVTSAKKILYASANVEVIDKTHVRISSDSTGLAYILTE